MSWWKQLIGEPVREPDPNPVIEARLQQLDELDRQNQFKRTQIGDYREEIKQLLAVVRYFVQKAAETSFDDGERRYLDQAAHTERRIKDLQTEIRQLEADINANHEQIVKQRQNLEQARADAIHNFRTPDDR